MATGAPHRHTALSRAESLRLLGAVGLGRVVFTEHALPAIRPANHLIDHNVIIVRADLGVAVLGPSGMVVAYQADEIDPCTYAGWSVTATGMARPVRDPDEVARYQRALRGWAFDGKDQVIAIQPEIVTGYLLTDR
jgi:pyridoxamine 5'-phosphate oxidase-like protein